MKATAFKVPKRSLKGPMFEGVYCVLKIVDRVKGTPAILDLYLTVDTFSPEDVRAIESYAVFCSVWVTINWVAGPPAWWRGAGDRTVVEAWTRGTVPPGVVRKICEVRVDVDNVCYVEGL